MKARNSIIAGLFSLYSIAGFAETNEKTCEYEVKGMTCAACATTLKIGLKKLEGINSVDASSEKGNAVVSFSSAKTDETKIRDAIDKVGYTATLKQCRS